MTYERNVHIGFGTSMKLVSLIEICFNETYRNVHTSECLCDSYPFQSGLKPEMLYRFHIRSVTVSTLTPLRVEYEASHPFRSWSSGL